MKQKIIFVMLAFVLSIFLSSLCFSAPGDVKNAGSIGGIASERAYGVDVYPNGDFIILSSVHSTSLGANDFINLTGKGSFDGLVAIFNYDHDTDVYASGYMYNFGGDAIDDVSKIVTTSDGGFAYAGSSEYESFNTGDWTGTQGFGAVDAALVMSNGDLNTDPSGKNVGTALYDRYYDVIEMSNGDIVAAGYSGPTSAISIFPKTGGTPASLAVPYGNIQNMFNGVTAGSDNCPVAAGDAYINNNAWNGLIGNGASDGIIMKFTTTGTIVWMHNFGGTGSDYFNDVITLADGGYVAVGLIGPGSLDSGGPWTGVLGNGDADAVIVKYANDGTFLWAKNFGGEGDDAFTSAAATADGGFVAVGYSLEGSFDTGDWAGIDGKGGGHDAIIVKYDADGDILWKYNFGGEDDDYFYDVAVQKNGNIVAVGGADEPSFGNGDLSDLIPRGATDIVYAVFEDVNYATVKFLKYGNNKDLIFDEQNVVEGGVVSAPATDPTRLGFAFGGWYTNEALTTQFNFTAPIDADTYVYPKWTADGQDVTITFNNGSGFDTRVVAFASTVKLSALASNAHGNFFYWKDGNGFVRSYNPNYTFIATEDITLNAVYAPEVLLDTPIVNIDTTNMAGTPVDGRIDISFFGDVVVPNNFTVIERGIIGSYYRETGDYNRTVNNFTLESTKIVKIPIPGTGTKIQATFKNAVSNEDYCARTYLTYELDGEPITIYSPAISIYRHTP